MRFIAIHFSLLVVFGHVHYKMGNDKMMFLPLSKKVKGRQIFYCSHVLYFIYTKLFHQTGLFMLQCSAHGGLRSPASVPGRVRRGGRPWARPGGRRCSRQRSTDTRSPRGRRWTWSSSLVVGVSPSHTSGSLAPCSTARRLERANDIRTAEFEMSDGKKIKIQSWVE